jgi:two-component system, LytTR family, sensor kinase
MQSIKTKPNFAYYLFSTWWAIAIVAHLCILNIYFNVDIIVSIVDSIIYNLVFALISIGLWFWVRYSDFETQKLQTILINHSASIILTIIFWITTSNFLLRNILTPDDSYLQFLKDSFPVRIVIGVLYYLVISISFYLGIYIQNFRDQLARETELRTLIRDAELNWLKLQINPHFLFNSLNSISSLTMSNPEKAQDMIIRLSELLRYSLKQSPQSFVPLKDEIDNCTKYLEIEKVRFGKRLGYSINTSDDFQNVSVPAMILQPLFENAIKHGVASSPEDGLIIASFNKVGNYLYIEISNTISTEFPVAKGTGVGISNISRRLSLLFGQNDLIKSKTDGNNYKVDIRIPLSNIKS